MDATVTQEELEAGRGYEELFVPALFEPWTQHLIHGAGVQEGSHVLDIACGSGVLTRHALSRSGQSGRVVGVDPAPGMIAAAKEVEPRIEWVLGGAEALEFDDGMFDLTQPRDPGHSGGESVHVCFLKNGCGQGLLSGALA